MANLNVKGKRNKVSRKIRQEDILIPEIMERFLKQDAKITNHKERLFNNFCSPESTIKSVNRLAIA